MKKFLLTLLLLVTWLPCAFAGGQGEDFTLYLIRHAEKLADGSSDPQLSEAGRQRAENLASWFSARSVEEIWSTDYERTRDTVAPLLQATGIELTIYDPQQLAKLSGQLLQRRANAVIVGHSNTTPELAQLLCECEIAPMEETEYERLIIIRIEDDRAAARALNQSELFSKN
jgi:phosphohistidine phosphatase SixA